MSHRRPVSGTAAASEVLVSSTVKDLVAGSGLTFEDAGEHELKGVPDRWRLYRVTAEGYGGVCWSGVLIRSQRKP